MAVSRVKLSREGTLTQMYKLMYSFKSTVAVVAGFGKRRICPLEARIKCFCHRLCHTYFGRGLIFTINPGPEKK